MEPEWNTHTVELGKDRVTKRFRSWSRDEPEREWRTLTLLARYAPGLAPLPVRAELTGDSPTVIMSRIPGTPLRGSRVDQHQISVVASAAMRLYRSVPSKAFDQLPVTISHPSVYASQVLGWTLPPSVMREYSLVARAWHLGQDWLESSTISDPAALESDAVLGHGDANLANYLWDGNQVRIVDFEDSGRSDLACELAELVEHGSTWVDSKFEVPAFLEHFELDGRSTARLLECRRFSALIWLALFSRDHPQQSRNPPGTLDRQAERLLALL